MSLSRRPYDILVVEDNPGDAHLIQEAFRECVSSCTVSVVETTSAARELLASRSFDLILSDMGAQNGSAAEFIRWIRSEDTLKVTPVIVISGSPNSRQAYEAGANAFIPKTMDMDRFFANIQHLMHFWTEVAELPGPPRRF